MDTVAARGSVLCCDLRSVPSLFFSIIISWLSFRSVLSPVDEFVLLLIWLSLEYCVGSIFSAGFFSGRDVVLEKVEGFLGSLLTLLGVFTSPFEGNVGGETAFIAVDGECSGVDVK